MNRLISLLPALAALPCGAATPKKPALVLAIAVDQFRYDYLTRFRSEYKEGFDQLLTRGAVFTSARYEHFPTVTAIGHSTFLSGATPSISGIVGNDWYDREEGRQVTSVSDDSVRPLGGGRTGASPQRMLVSTVGDEMRMAGNDQAKIIGISMKDRSAILPAGHAANAAYWFDTPTGNFVSSTFYFPELPGWVRDFNAGHPADRYKGTRWLSKQLPDTAGENLYSAVVASPSGNELLEAFTERAIDAEQLGKRNTTDLLSVSFSSNDYVGHGEGPDSPLVRDISIRTDRVLGKLFQFIDSRIGMQNVLIVLTADHGVAPVPEINKSRRMPGGRMPPGSIFDAVEKALTDRYGAGKWITSPSEHSIYLNLQLIHDKKLDEAEVQRTAAQAALRVPHVFRVYTREQLMNGAALEDQVGRRVMNGFYVRRSADVYVLVEPYWMFGTHGTTHGTTFSYDAHVPVIFMGPGIRAGLFHEPVTVNDIAPTLAVILRVETPSGSVGRVLSEIFAD